MGRGDDSGRWWDRTDWGGMTMASPQTDHGVNTSQEVLRRRLIGVAAVTAVLATLHFIDHVIRGQLVLDRGLDPAWNHSGWPFQSRFSPFTISLIVIYGMLLGGIVLTLRGRVWAGYWLVTAILLGAVVSRVHFVPGPNTRIPQRDHRHLWQSRGRDHGGHHHLRDRRKPHHDGCPGHLGPPGHRTLVMSQLGHRFQADPPWASGRRRCRVPRPSGTGAVRPLWSRGSGQRFPGTWGRRRRCGRPPLTPRPRS